MSEEKNPKKTVVDWYERTRLWQLQFVQNADVVSEIAIAALSLGEAIVAASLVGVDGEVHAPGYARAFLHGMIAYVSIKSAVSFIPSIESARKVLDKDFRKLLKPDYRFSVVLSSLLKAVWSFLGAIVFPALTFLIIANGSGNGEVLFQMYYQGNLFNPMHHLRNVNYTLFGTFVMTIAHYWLSIFIIFSVVPARMNWVALNAAYNKAKEEKDKKDKEDKKEDKPKGEPGDDAVKEMVANSIISPDILDIESWTDRLRELQDLITDTYTTTSNGKENGEKYSSEEKIVMHAGICAELLRLVVPDIDDLIEPYLEDIKIPTKSGGNEPVEGFEMLKLQYPNRNLEFLIAYGDCPTIGSNRNTFRSMNCTATSKQRIEAFLKFMDGTSKKIPTNEFFKQLTKMIIENPKIKDIFVNKVEYPIESRFWSKIQAHRKKQFINHGKEE